jgi:hypothetical protein
VWSDSVVLESILYGFSTITVIQNFPFIKKYFNSIFYQKFSKKFYHSHTDLKITKPPKLQRHLDAHMSLEGFSTVPWSISTGAVRHSG